MVIPVEHVHLYQEIFQIPGIWRGPVMLFGNPEVRLSAFCAAGRRGSGIRHLVSGLKARLLQFIRRHPAPSDVPVEYRSRDLAELLARRGITSIDVIDLFDPNANLRHDMNTPVPTSWHQRCHTLIDLGSLEHVFDTRVCLENCLRMVEPGGFYILLTCVKGYYGHGMHVFDPSALKDAIFLNGFEPVYERFTDNKGRPLQTPEAAENCLMWLVARKSTELGEFHHPQQQLWLKYYGQSASDRPRENSR